MYPTQSTLVFYVNGRKIVEPKADAECSLLEYLRNKLGLCGTKLGCSEGGCGACTVMVSKFDRKTSKINHLSVNACLTPVCSVHGLAVTTVEGIGSTNTQLHPIQERLSKAHGSQCGFCTPGFVMSMYTLLRNNPQPEIKEILTYFQGNLCRCTGYRPIIEGCQTFTKESCCKKSNGCCNGNGFKNDDMEATLMDPSEFLPYDSSQEPIFPPELQTSDQFDKELLKFEGNVVNYYRPVTLEELLELKTQHPSAKLTVGHTEIGIEMKFKNLRYPVLIAPNAIPELVSIHKNSYGITVGAAVTLSQLEQILHYTIQQEPEYKTKIFASILEMLEKFAGKQIRNAASLGGNIATASPISDLCPLMLAARAQLTLVSKRGERTIIMGSQFFTGYRKTLLHEDEIIKSITIPYTRKNEYFHGFKQSQRREDDIAIVNSGMRLLLDDNHKIRELSLVYGGMGPTMIVAQQTAQQLIDKPWNNSIVDKACHLLLTEMPLHLDAPGGMVQFRRTLTISFFFKFYLKVLMELQNQQTSPLLQIPRTEKSATNDFHLHHPQAAQRYQIVAPGQRLQDPIGRPLAHKSGALHTTGEALYCDDIPQVQGELHLAFVTSPRAHAQIVSIDASNALAQEGVKTFLCEQDLPGDRNLSGRFGKDTEVFARNEVTYNGQIVGAIVAETKAIAQRAAKLVKLELKDLHPVVLTIEDAIAANSFFHKHSHTAEGGDVEKGMQQAHHVIDGQVRIGGQHHFYLETHCGQATFHGENQEIILTSSCQAPAMVQAEVAKSLDIPSNRIVVKTKRIGGGFGGKGMSAAYYSIPIALAAYKLQKPVRFMMDRDEDLTITGGRHTFLLNYKVGFSNSGRLIALCGTAYSNGGNSLDVSALVLEEFLMKLDIAYNIPNVHVTGHVCKTNLAPNTAFRGFGAPQAMMITQTILDQVSHYLHMDPLKIRELNFYQEGDRTFYGQLITHCTLKSCWEECLQQSEYNVRKTEVQQFNKGNRWKKRGISVLPMKYGLGFSPAFMNQGAALVHIYTDGTVLITHGGVEMGQGLHTKTLQVASRVLQIPIEKIHLSETSTDKVPNATATAGSFATDLFAPAVQNACQILMDRLEPMIRKNPKGRWEDWVIAAYMNRISLSCTGFNKLEVRDKDEFHYYSYGAACSVVEIDCLTGDHQILRTDIVMDVGESLNPAVDIGQIEGAFVQGCGLYTMEELRYSARGELLTRGPGTYKIPGCGDIPNIFNVSMLKGSSNVHAIYSSKAIGEPPLLLAATVFFAIKNAINAARNDEGMPSLVTMDSPATAEKIRMACSDKFTSSVAKTYNGEVSAQPWFLTV